MNKELTPLKAFNRVRYDLLDVMTEYHKSLFDIIETALKDHEKHLSIQNFIKKESVIFVSDDRIKCYFDIPKTKGNAELFDLLKEVLK